MDINEKIKEAIKLLTINGYIVTKLTQDMINDMQKCEESNCSKDCGACSCNKCIVNC